MLIMMLSVIFAALIQLELRYLLSRRFSSLTVRSFRNSDVLLILSLINIKRIFLSFKIYAYFVKHSTLREITFSSSADVDLSFLRFVIVLKIKVKVKSDRESLYITHATDVIILRLSVNEQTRRATVKTVFILTLLCRSVTTFFTTITQRSNYLSSFSSDLKVSMSFSSDVIKQ